MSFAAELARVESSPDLLASSWNPKKSVVNDGWLG
jgi:hypothetical protein